MIKFKEQYNSVVAFNKNWVCGLSDQDNVELALHCEIVDMDGATGEPEYKEYPYVVSVSIVAAYPHHSFNELMGEDKPDQLSLIEDCMSYMGGVPVDHKLLDMDKDNKDITGNLKAKEACLVTKACDYGTVAAQNGKGTEITYPQFKTEEAAQKWIKELVKLYGDCLMSFVGFTLDQPINMIGDTGWGVIENQVSGRK